MPNYIKYSTTIPSGSLKKGNAALGITNEVTGPTSTTGWYSGINPPTGSYTIYEVAATGDPDIYCPVNTTELLNLVKSKGATGSDTGSVAAALAWIATQPNLLATNEVYPNIITSGSVMMVDAGFVGSYPTTASTWYDISGNGYNGTLTNGPTFNSSGYINFDGTDDYVVSPPTSFTANNDFTYEIWVNSDQYISSRGILSNKGYWQTGGQGAAIGNISTPQTIYGYVTTNTGHFDINSNVGPTYSWTHVIMRRLSNDLRFFINGAYQGTTRTISGTVTDASDRFWLGTYSNGSTPWKGNMSIARIYNRALTQTEILQNYYQAPIVTDGLVLALDAGNLVSYESGSTTTYSLTGSISGSLVNGTGYSNINNGTWVFDGVDDRIVLSNKTLFDFTGSVSFDIWFSTDNINTAFQTLFSKAEGGAYGMEINTGLGPDSIVFLLYINGAYRTATDPMSNYIAGRFYNLVGTYNGSFIKLYRNGNEVASTAQTGNISVTNEPLTLGMNPGNSGASFAYPLNGKIALFRSYNRALTADEVSQNFNAQKTRFGL